MSSTISATPTGNYLNGIIYKLKNDLKIDPISKNYVEVLSMGTRTGNINSLIAWNGTFSTSFDSKSWFQLTFPERYVFPTHYSFKGPGDGWCFALEWNVYGIYEGDQSNSNKWVLLASNNAYNSNFCSGHTDYTYGSSVGLFSLTYTNSQTGFRAIRWITSKSSTSCSSPCFTLGGLDIFGTLMEKKESRSIKCSCQHEKNFINSFIVLYTMILNS